MALPDESTSGNGAPASDETATGQLPPAHVASVVGSKLQVSSLPELASTGMNTSPPIAAIAGVGVFALTVVVPRSTA